MKFNFMFNPDTHNFWPVYEAIRQYYPIGLEKNEYGLYYKYSGIKELEKVVVEAIHGDGNKNYLGWKTFCEKVSSKQKLTYRGSTFGQAPSFSADFFLQDIDLPQFRRIKKLSVAISLIGKFFTIYGVDETIVKECDENGRDLNYRGVNVITASPYMEFRPHFLDLKQEVEKEFNGYKFLPFSIHLFVINGLEVRYSDRKECTIFHALFNEQLDLNSQLPIRGDQHFGFEEWGIENTKITETTILPPRS
ncbi:hypothetical protein ACVWYG_001908 [Pedobacter sp. UYEF25]